MFQKEKATRKEKLEALREQAPSELESLVLEGAVDGDASKWVAHLLRIQLQLMDVLEVLAADDEPP